MSGWPGQWGLLAGWACPSPPQAWDQATAARCPSEGHRVHSRSAPGSPLCWTWRTQMFYIYLVLQPAIIHKSLKSISRILMCRRVQNCRWGDKKFKLLPLHHLHCRAKTFHHYLQKANSEGLFYASLFYVNASPDQKRGEKIEYSSEYYSLILFDEVLRICGNKCVCDSPHCDQMCAGKQTRSEIHSKQQKTA